MLAHPLRSLRNALDPALRLRLKIVHGYGEPRLLFRPQVEIERLHLRRRYLAEQGRPLDLDDPAAYSEKIQWRKLYDRRELYPRLSDKLAVRDHVASRVGRAYLVPVLAVGATTADIPFEDLDPPYVVKPTHASGIVALVPERTDPHEPERLADVDAATWDPYGIWLVEWAYWRIPRRVMVERLLQRPDGKVPWDYKVHVFDGRALFVEVYVDRFGHRVCSIFDRSWTLTDAGYPGRPSAGELDRPGRLDEMLEVSEALAGDLDYLRVDLYALADGVRVGELTLYPASGFRRFDPPEWDERWGALWKLPEPEGDSRG